MLADRDRADLPGGSWRGFRSRHSPFGTLCPNDWRSAALHPMPVPMEPARNAPLACPKVVPCPEAWQGSQALAWSRGGSVPRGREAGPTEKAAICMITQTSLSEPAAHTVLTSDSILLRVGKPRQLSWVVLQTPPPSLRDVYSPVCL